MMTLSNIAGHREKQKSVRKHIWARLLVLVGLGTMVFAVCSLLSGCGSDSTPKGTVSGKSDKDALRKNKGAQGTLPLVREKGSTLEETGNVGNIKKFDKQVRGLPNSQEKMDELNAAAVKKAESLNPEILPGVTRRELERKMEEARRKAESQNVEILPGVTREEVNRRNAEPLKKNPQP